MHPGLSSSMQRRCFVFLIPRRIQQACCMPLHCIQSLVFQGCESGALKERAVWSCCALPCAALLWKECAELERAALHCFLLSQSHQRISLFLQDELVNEFILFCFHLGQRFVFNPIPVDTSKAVIHLKWGCIQPIWQTTVHRSLLAESCMI